MLGQETVVGAQPGIKNRSVLAIYLIEHKGIIPVERQFVFQQHGGNAQRSAYQLIVIVLIGHIGVIRPHVDIDFLLQQSQGIHQHRHLGVGIGHA